MARNPAFSMHGRGVTKKEDRWFSKAIRQRDNNTCRCCQSTEELQCAHLYGRATKSTRWLPLNAMCLCRRCHARFTAEPLQWALFCTAELGTADFEELTRINKTVILKTTDAMRQAISDHYRTEYNRMVSEGTHDLKAWHDGQADDESE